MVSYKDSDICPECTALKDVDEEKGVLEDHKSDCDCDFCSFEGLQCHTCGFEIAYGDM